MSQSKDHRPGSSAPSVVNWGPPSKRGLVEQAVLDGLEDPAKIVALAKTRDVILTFEEIEQIKADLKKN